MAYITMVACLMFAAACFLLAVASAIEGEIGRRRFGRRGRFRRFRLRNPYGEQHDGFPAALLGLGCVALLMGMAVGLASGDLWRLAGLVWRVFGV
ncbi:hypothetical protein BLEM_1111 [Bifidobacterium lemurum]|uniref:Uncharacterized protein n=1 Tax=Bifidobacterium lemurum TaxID=1603886 RepID=A0A261FUE9_9BIFI|nr:hypothetical protein [Bifidobacterium lemurum]OZG62565.1 hypothetical protein BLEM_1111 [Bifidobacterium lemurum]QOL33897.1 hypothetical protein BL8807_09025 [Bifidobacterium lemurum]